MPMAKANILVVEDEAMIALDIQTQLIQQGYNVAGICVTGADAVSRAAELKVDLVLTDVLLAGRTDGIEAARRIRKLHNIPVIFLTAHADVATIERAKHAEPYGYLIKPFDPRTLNATIEIALHKHKMECNR
jgi:two-component system cell cycle sensor histidine kinase/response regulator CckA